MRQIIRRLYSNRKRHTNDWRDWSSDMCSSDLTANGEVDMYILGWGPSTYDGDYGLFPNFHSSQKGGSGNRSQYANPKMDQLLEDGRKEMDVEKRRDLYRQAVDLINEEAVVLPLYYPLTSVGYSKAIKGVKAESYPMVHKYSY